MIVRCHQSGPLPGALNMAIDTALASALDEGRIGPTVRFYGWQPHALSLGYHQDAAEVDAALLAERGIDLVRRPTGGKAILHAHEVTYCAVFPLEGTSPRELYRSINESLIRGLRLVGVEASLSGTSDDLRTIYREAASVPCFTSSARSELLVDGRKLVGSAQRRQGGCRNLPENHRVVRRSTEPRPATPAGGKPVEATEQARVDAEDRDGITAEPRRPDDSAEAEHRIGARAGREVGDRVGLELRGAGRAQR